MLAVSAFAVFMSGPGQTYGVSVFIDPMLDDTGWSRSLVSTLYSLATLFGAGVILVAGRTIDAKGNRRVMLLATVLFAVGLIIASFAISPIMLLAGFGLMRAFGSGSLSLSSKTVIPHWFEARRGRAFSVLGLAAAISLAFFPLYGNFVIGHVGWRQAWRIDALLIMLVLLPVIFIVTKDHPSEVGQRADGAEHDPALTDKIVDVIDEVAFTLKQAMKERSFWLLIMAGVVPSLVVTGLAFNQVSILNSRGFDSGLAASTFTVESMVAVPVTLLSGWMSDRVRPRYVLAGSQAMLALAMLVLLFATTVPMVLLYAAVRGFSSGLWGVAADVIWPTYFGRRNLGSIRGATFSVGIVGAALGPIPLSLAFDLLGSYSLAIAGLMILPVLGTIGILMAKPPAKRELPPLDQLAVS